MAKRTEISTEEVKEIEIARKKNKDKNIEKRLNALMLHSEGKKHGAIAIETGFSKDYISVLVRKYKEMGLDSVAKNHQHSNNELLSRAEEEELLAPFQAAAEAGQVVDVKEIKLAYEEKIGRELNSRGHIYRMLKRHGWRKVMPRSKHPNKASDEAVEASKKLTLWSTTN